MLLLEQLQLSFRSTDILSVGQPGVSPGESTGRMPARPIAGTAVLQLTARELLRAAGASRIAAQVRVEWNPRLRSCAGRANFRDKLVSLNPRLRDHGSEEIERTLRHELAHLLAEFRAGRRRILPHGPEWCRACHDLGISDETRCHNLPFPISERVRLYVYKCPNCLRDFPRVRRIKRVVACLACCRAHNRGKFAAKFRLQLLERSVMT